MPGSEVCAISAAESASTSVPRAPAAVESVAVSFGWVVSGAGPVPVYAVSGSSAAGAGGVTSASASDWVMSGGSEGANRYHSPTASAAAMTRMESLPRIVRTPGRLAARIHRFTAADADPTVLAALNAIMVLDVPAGTSARPDSRSPCQFGHHRASLRKSVRICGWWRSAPDATSRRHRLSAFVPDPTSVFGLPPLIRAALRARAVTPCHMVATRMILHRGLAAGTAAVECEEQAAPRPIQSSPSARSMCIDSRSASAVLAISESE